MKKAILWTALVLGVMVVFGVASEGDSDVAPVDIAAEWQDGPPDATYILVEHTVKKTAHDPGSVSVEPDACSRTGGEPDTGWLVTCEYRGKNAMGATVLESGTFRIIRVEDGYAALPE